MTIDQDKLGELLGTFVTDLGATMGAGNVVVGHRLGLYRGLADAPATPEQLAERTGADPRYIAEWLCGQAAGGDRGPQVVDERAEKLSQLVLIDGHDGLLSFGGDPEPSARQ